MKLRDLLKQLQQTQKEIGASTPYLCGGTPRDKYMDQLEKVSDIDITTGDKTVDYLSEAFADKLSQQYKINRKNMPDGHSTIFIGDLKLDFSSNFIVPNIDFYLQKKGIKSPSNFQREMFSRDFTCNSLLLSLDLKNVIDPTKMGFRDIKEKKIKTCLDPEITLTSNKNRVIRAVYLSSKLDFDIDNSIVDFVKKNPQSVQDSSQSSLSKKLNEAFAWDSDRAGHNITKMNLWNYIPVTKDIYPYYIKYFLRKKAYFQGGEGVNEPAPKKKKYKSDPAIVNQPRFEEPLYDNYDLYETEGVDGPAKHGPGTGLYQNMEKYKSVSDFRDKKKKNKEKYKADDSYIQDDGSITKSKKKVAYFHGGEGVNEPTPKKPKYEPDPAIIIESRLPFYNNYNTYDAEGVSGPEKGGPGAGFYQNMSKVKGVADFIDKKHNDRKEYIVDDLVTKPKRTKKANRRRALLLYLTKYASDDVNNIDFLVDDQIKSAPILGENGIVSDSVPIGGILDKYVPKYDFEGKPPTDLDFGTNYGEESIHDYIAKLQEMMDEKLETINPKEPPIFGLPQGIDPVSDLDNLYEQDPRYGVTESGNTTYDKM